MRRWRDSRERTSDGDLGETKGGRTGLATYCPYDLVDDAASLGLVETDVPTSSFGRVHLVSSGRPTGDRVTVFLHGVGGSWVSWSPVVRYARDHGVDLGDILVLDLPGFGTSERAQADLDVDRVGDMVSSVVREQGWARMDLVGHSMGGFLALNMASRGPAGLESVRSISGAYLSIVRTAQDPKRALRTDRAAAMAYFGLKALASLGPVGPALARGAYHLGLLPLFLGNTVAHPWQLRKSIKRGMANSVNPSSFLLAAQNGREYDPRERWSRITVPVRATFGAADKLVPPSDGRELAEILPNADVHVIDDAGHFAHTERPDAVVELVLAPLS